jgi:hypothetical protein
MAGFDLKEARWQVWLRHASELPQSAYDIDCRNNITYQPAAEAIGDKRS